MAKDSLYTDEIWLRFKDKFGQTPSSFKLKKYPQLDPYFDFLNYSELVKEKIEDSSLKSIQTHSFTPFVKILTKTPRYRYQEDKACYSLDTKIRPISFASHFDSYIYAFYAFALTEKYQEYIRSKDFHESVIAYRTDLNGQCNIQFAKEAFNRVQERISKTQTCSAIALDITGYFDNIDHFLLKEKWCKILDFSELPIDQYKVFRSLTKYSYLNFSSFLNHFNINLNHIKKQGLKWQSLLDLMDDKIAGPSFLEKLNYLREKKLIVTNLPKLNRETNELEFKGIPQGSSMSAVLSNIYLIDFDEYIVRIGKKYGFTYRRYCDDLLIVCNTSDAKEINALVLLEIEKYKLVIQPKKTERIDFHVNSKGIVRGFNYKKKVKDKINLVYKNESKYYKSLQYLGFEFNGQNSYVRPGSLSRYFQKMKGRIVKTILMSYSNKSKADFIHKKQLYDKYSHLGKRNFLSYVRDAAQKTYKKSSGIVREGLDSIHIKRQLSHHFRIIENEIRKTSEQRFLQKEVKNEIKKNINGRIKKNIFKI
ncbi:reverse transcriptase domain-containing protein [Mucilaginibacter sp. OK098]|uniref:reverse transcriptase domain-containing protein n=1 Tax=Mucilaginibacter sp. OK098 TaxID=1855297 RepID=UPI00091C3688|nr:reverse transcriptase domain-containing protein [Mucilaginibacter sp. OK098]SHM54437.1 Reverse transcriptase (RNA-dependent DNA polymerase) [Mucilaginibacter sp. OK098]